MNKKDNIVILFLAYGASNLYYQVVFCILTMFYHLNGKFNNIEIVIYTDKLKVFRKFLKGIPVSIELLSKEDIKEYKGPMNFVHRVKTCVLQDCFIKYKKDIFYMDGDTFFWKNPIPLFARISKEVSIMNTNEFDLNEGGGFEDINWVTLRRVLKENQFSLKGKNFKIPLTARMWNAGVTGISYDNAHLVEDVLNLTDQIFSKSSLFSAEQFSLSYILQQETQLTTSEDYVEHYWPNNGKRKWDFAFHSFFKENGNAPIDVLAKKAFELTNKSGELIVPEVSLSEKTLSKLKLIARIIIKG
ncbi:hypothetical protein [Rufibacter tibetensis]|uniref:Nucleotide-diphospho-sugar transferase domain-containing protein n=1 Tax=Rufibacter tibetensis TaxID=512763 RepID=A0A0P0C8E5_9BACT|nr:hypothetical protein [Rufibacter tibetensis]ALI99754.1 hypothetical protein DC20_13195 [Rufibacter tibetensis]